MKLYKFTDKNYKTKNNTTWELNKTNKIDQELRKPRLCTPGVLHAYADLNLALLTFPMHCIQLSRIFECDGEVVCSDNFKVGVYELTPIKAVELPGWYKNVDVRLKVCVKFAELCAEEAAECAEEAAEAAEAAGRIGWVAAEVARAAEAATGRAEWAAECAELCAEYAAEEAAEAAAEYAAECAAEAAEKAAIGATEYTAEAARWANKKIDFAKLAKQAIKECGGRV